MSNTYRNNDYNKYQKATRLWLHSEITDKEYRDIEKEFRYSPMYYAHVNNRPNAAKFIIQVLGNRRRRNAELKVSREIIKTFGHWNEETLIHISDTEPEEYTWPYPAIEAMEYEAKLARNFSNPWDYY